MRVRDLIGGKKGEVIRIAPTSYVAAAARLLMEHGIGGLPVVRGEALVGFIAERDIVRALHRGFESVRQLPVEAVMTRPAPICNADDQLNAVMVRMNRERLRHVVVIDGEKVIGILSVGDLVKNRLEELEMEAGVLRDYVVGQRARH